MIVKVIGHTVFAGVPEELRNGKEPCELSPQDQGSSMARLIECAGRCCYDSYGKGRDSAAYHQHILESMHGSVLEHCSLTFFISGISRGCSHELVRHRAGIAISQRSTRYVDESETEWAWHPLLEAMGCGNDEASVGVMAQAKTAYGFFVRKITERLIGQGVDPTTARKQARGAARGVLGNSLSTELVWTANIRALRNVIEQRATAAADAEIRLLANRLYEKALIYCPQYFSDYVKSECPDGIGYSLATEYRKV